MTSPSAIPLASPSVGRERVRTDAGRNRHSVREEVTPVSLALSGAVILLVSYVFYDSFRAAVFLLPLAVPVIRSCARYRREREQKELLTAFRELLGDLLTGLRAGWSVENALRECSGEMRERYGSSRIVKELNRIVNGMDNQIPTEQLLLEFGERSGVEEIRDFATVFAIARRGSGNLAEILQRTGALISDRIETGNEIETLLAGRRLEQHIMDAIPFFLILYIRLTSPGFFTALYHNAAGIAVMSVCLGVYLAALALAERISDIHV